ncbi:MAG: DivIVA domain-containing protein [Acidimicrobiia bacterium]
MSEQLSADEVAAAQFRTKVRGYDPADVREFVAQVAAALRSAEEERDRLSERLKELGDRDLRTEFDLVSDDLKRILYDAQVTADGLRERATADAEDWRVGAREESAETVRAAEEDAEALRREAWATSEQLVEQSAEEAERIRQGAERDALSIIGEAEREAHRTVSAARREAEDLVRVSKMEADRLQADTRTRHDEIIDEARKEAETSQERARALEVRRAELLTELEGVRSTIQRLEHQIDERTSAPEEPIEPATVRVVDAPDEQAEEAAPGAAEAKNDSTEWGTEENVRIVPPQGTQPELPEAAEEPVDATEMADEVRRLREAQQSQSEQALEPAIEQLADVDEEVDQLFATLRLQPVEQPEAPAEKVEEEPQPPPKTVEEEPQTPPKAVEEAPEQPAPSGDPGEVQAKLLVPIVNKRLRNVKRRLTDAQSLALEELRADPEWSPNPTGLADELRSELSGLVQDSYGAGANGAGQLYGLEVGVPEPAVADPTDDFAEALCTEVQSALDRARESDQAPAKVVSSVSRVYRSWRTDHSERRVAALAETAYGEGLQDTLAAAGVATS